MVLDPLVTVQGVIDKISYKPEWTFRCGLSPVSDDIEVRMTFNAKDSTGKRIGYDPVILSIRISYEIILRAKNAEEYVKETIFHSIRTMEMHEIDEWLKYNGVHVNDPHPERKIIDGDGEKENKRPDIIS